MEGEEGVRHADPDDPLRRRANKRSGHETWEDDRPPICGVAGRDSGQVRLTVVANSDGKTLRRVVRTASEPGAMVYADGWRGYDRQSEMRRGHATVCHADREWARDDDGDGTREVHDNTLEGLWAGLRNSLRPFRGVSKKYLNQYVAMFERGSNAKRATTSFLRAPSGVGSAIEYPQ